MEWNGGTLITLQVLITHNFLIIYCLFVSQAIFIAFLMYFIHPFIESFGLFINFMIDDEISITPQVYYFKYFNFNFLRYFLPKSSIPAITNIDFINFGQH